MLRRGIVRHIPVPHPYGRLAPAFGAALRASKFASRQICRTLRGISVPPLSAIPNKKPPGGGLLFGMAESEGFEPPDPRGPTVFKTAAFDHSATSPYQLQIISIRC